MVAPMIQVTKSETYIMAQLPCGSSGVLDRATSPYASGTRTITVLMIAIHIGVTVSPAQRMMPERHWVTSIAIYPTARICIIR